MEDKPENKNKHVEPIKAGFVDLDFTGVPDLEEEYDDALIYERLTFSGVMIQREMLEELRKMRKELFALRQIVGDMRDERTNRSKYARENSPYNKQMHKV